MARAASHQLSRVANPAAGQEITMDYVEAALAAALEAQRSGAARLAKAGEQLAALGASRNETGEKLEEAKANLKSASAALVADGGGDAFHSAMDQVATLEARLRAFDEIAIPQAQAAYDATSAEMPCEQRIAALRVRVEVGKRVLPLYEQAADRMAELEALFANIQDVHAGLRHEHRGAYPTLFGRETASFLAELLNAVPPGVRALCRHLFCDGVLQPVFENRFVPHSPDALATFRARVDREPSEADLAKFNGPILQLPDPPPPPEPRPEPGPPKMRGFDAGPGAI